MPASAVHAPENPAVLFATFDRTMRSVLLLAALAAAALLPHPAHGASLAATALPALLSQGPQAATGAAANGGQTWAVLVAGSNGYDNYRHQADVCHAYQILHAHGLDDDHIVVMMYDDIANNGRNPSKGKIFNEPGGPDVYAGVKKSYTGSAVTPANFLKALTGLNSTKDDDVFVYFADHGGGGILGFPNKFFVIPQFLHERDFEKALKGMHAAGKYGRMVLLVEACNSGSMFADWLTKGDASLDLYVATAATPYESSWACYHSARANSFLGDCFSNHWMEDDDNQTAASFGTRTFAEQFAAVTKDTWTSTPCQYGDVEGVASLPLGDFEAKPAAAAGQAGRKLGAETRDAVRAEDVALALAERRGDTGAAARERAARAEADARALRVVHAVAFGDGPRKPPAACAGRINEIACYSQCPYQDSAKCAALCCGAAQTFFPTPCVDGPDGNTGGMNCFLDCCSGPQTAGLGPFTVCVNHTAAVAKKCQAQCCGASACQAGHYADRAAVTDAAAVAVTDAARDATTVCYKQWIALVLRACPAFLAGDYAQIKHAGLLRGLCKAGHAPGAPGVEQRVAAAC